MTTKPATPLPWTAETYAVANLEQEHGWTIKSGDDSIIDMPIVKGGCYSAKEVKSIAAYIVRAGNAYPELVAALREVAQHAIANDRGSFNVSADRIRTARALLAKLGEGGQ